MKKWIPVLEIMEISGAGTLFFKKHIHKNRYNIRKILMKAYKY